MLSLPKEVRKNKKREKHPKEYNSWNGMKQRCDNPKNKQYKDYGGRGISYEKRWFYFDNFIEDMGLCPEGMTLDRIDVDGNYGPSNCRWASRTVQQRNLRCHIRPDVGVTYDNKHPYNKWQVGIYVNNKKIANRFKTKEEAIAWRIAKELELWGKERKNNERII